MSSTRVSSSSSGGVEGAVVFSDTQKWEERGDIELEDITITGESPKVMAPNDLP